MSKELKAPDKVTQKMTRDGAIAENLTTGEATKISDRPQEENYSAPAGAAAEKVAQQIGAGIERHAAKGAEKKALDAAQPQGHSSRLQFSEAERATPELQKAIKKSDKAADRLDAARAAIPQKTKIKKERVFDEAKGKAKTRLSFEKTDKPPNGKLRHNPLSRPAQELDNAVHGKIYEVEKENVGVESGHRIELAGEKAGGMAVRTVKRGIRSHKLKPYRAAAAAEKKAVKANADFLYQKALHDNPALAHSNPISRFWQKQRIKRQYAKTLKAGGKAKKTAEATAKAAKKTAEETKRATFFVVRHWKGCLIVGGIAFIVLLLFGGLSSCSLFGGNSGSGLIASSYLSEDADLGHTVNFKTRKQSYKSKKKLWNDPSEWVIFENTQPPIVEESVFLIVQNIRRSRRRPTKMGDMGIFSGLLYCAECGGKMYQCRATNFTEEQKYFICSTYRKGKDLCTTHSIKNVVLHEIVLQNLREAIAFVTQHEAEFVQEAADSSLRERDAEFSRKRDTLSKAESRIAELDNLFKHLYEDNVTGKLSDERFIKMSHDYELEQENLKAMAGVLREEIKQQEKQKTNVKAFINAVKKYTDMQELDAAILREFIDHIEVSHTDKKSKTREITIVYNFIGAFDFERAKEKAQNTTQKQQRTA